MLKGRWRWCWTWKIWGECRGAVCFHNRSSCRHLPFETCLEAIRDFAFVASSYPLILALEMHFSEDVQSKVVELMNEILGYLLYKPSLIDRPGTWNYGQLSPEYLEGRILVSTKLPPEFYERQVVRQEGPGRGGCQTTENCQMDQGGHSTAREGDLSLCHNPRSGEQLQPSASNLRNGITLLGSKNCVSQQRVDTARGDDESDEFVITKGKGSGQSGRLPGRGYSEWGREIPDFNASGLMSKSFRSGHMMPLNLENLWECEIEEVNEAEDPKFKSAHLRQLILLYAARLSRERLSAGCPADAVNKIFSVSEPQMMMMKDQMPMDIISFTQKHLVRVYPLDYGFDNYNPFIAWSVGAQLASFNMQDWGRPLWVLSGLFQANGGCGYVKKPGILLRRRQVLLPNNDREVHLCDMGSDVRAEDRVHDWYPGAVDCLQNGSVIDPSSALVHRTNNGYVSSGTVELPFSSSMSVKLTLQVIILSVFGCMKIIRKRNNGRSAGGVPIFSMHVGISGVVSDSVMKRTDEVDASSMHKWESSTFSFPLTVPELAVFRMELHYRTDSSSDRFAGQNSFPVSELRNGYRATTLLNENLTPINHVQTLLIAQLLPSSEPAVARAFSSASASALALASASASATAPALASASGASSSQTASPLGTTSLVVGPTQPSPTMATASAVVSGSASTSEIVAPVMPAQLSIPPPSSELPPGQEDIPSLI
ncbi:hypothetical protein CBR_g24440 [Chara braunii]|uniref:phosphoinositide phospholipase C n=1 Tax=Chara braunii TaxID=69332 RepID=A0A388JMS1_CHABU|nr:hypothetical protein CBR_g24440 [Chara braunii]|eukprot:GBG59097.1 hypothetical protein CBR_g24440 [Chara braunii]